MAKVILAIGLVLVIGATAHGQHGSAPAGYYPPTYAGDTWTGIVTSVSDQSREITLTYANKDKTETFIGILQAGYKINLKDGSTRELKPSNIPIGAHLIVYYTAATKKVDGKKIKTYEIFKLAQIVDDQKK